MMTEKALQASGLTPLGKLVGFQYAGCDPSRMGLGPVYAIHKAEQRHGLGLKNADLIEINEAFAAQVVGCQRAAVDAKYCREKLGRDSALGEIPDEILNVNGGGIALGHPVGVTGARLVLTALKELHRRKAKRALLSLCVGGGQGGALWVENRLTFVLQFPDMTDFKNIQRETRNDGNLRRDLRPGQLAGQHLRHADLRGTQRAPRLPGRRGQERHGPGRHLPLGQG